MAAEVEWVKDPDGGIGRIQMMLIIFQESPEPPAAKKMHLSELDQRHSAGENIYSEPDFYITITITKMLHFRFFGNCYL